MGFVTVNVKSIFRENQNFLSVRFNVNCVKPTLFNVNCNDDCNVSNVYCGSGRNDNSESDITFAGLFPNKILTGPPTPPPPPGVGLFLGAEKRMRGRVVVRGGELSQK